MLFSLMFVSFFSIFFSFPRDISSFSHSYLLSATRTDSLDLFLFFFSNSDFLFFFSISWLKKGRIKKWNESKLHFRVFFSTTMGTTTAITKTMTAITKKERVDDDEEDEKSQMVSDYQRREKKNSLKTGVDFYWNGVNFRRSDAGLRRSGVGLRRSGVGSRLNGVVTVKE